MYERIMSAVHPSMSIGQVIVGPEPLILLECLSSINFLKQDYFGQLSMRRGPYS